MIIDIPAMLDPHTHLRDLDWAHKATFESETAAALAGGYWAVFDMPNTFPSTVSRAALDVKLARMSAGALCDWGMYFGGMQPPNDDQFASVIDDVCGIKLYNNATTGNLLMDDQAVRETMYRTWTGHKPIAVHAEGETVSNILLLVRQYRRFTHFCHISTREEINLLRDAKHEGLPISVGVCPHHLYLTQNDLPALGALGWMKPELKTRADAAALWDAIADGTVDIIESDHAPHTLEEKASAKPPYGVPGLETTLPLMGLALKEGRITQDQIIALVADNPRRIFCLSAPADTFTRVDLEDSYVITGNNLHTKPKWSPFEGMRVYGRVREVWIRGVKAFDGENVLVSSGFGCNIGREVNSPFGQRLTPAIHLIKEG